MLVAEFTVQLLWTPSLASVVLSCDGDCQCEGPWKGRLLVPLRSRKNWVHTALGVHGSGVCARVVCLDV